MVIILMVLAMLFSLSLYLWPDSVWLMRGDLEKVRSTAGIAVVVMFAGLLLRLW
jgi:hypothetical protein